MLNNIGMSSGGGIAKGNILPLHENSYHGMIFVWLEDNLSEPKLMQYNAILRKWNPVGSSNNGGIFITNVRPQDSAENVSNKIYGDVENVKLDSIISTTSKVIVDVLLITGWKNYVPNATVNNVPLINVVKMLDRPLFTANILLDLESSNILKAVHEDGAYHQVNVSYNKLPKITSALFIGNYPIENMVEQSELKENDLVQIKIQTDKPVIRAEISNYGACKSQIFTFSESDDISISNILIANRGNTVQDLPIKLRVQSNDGGWSDWYTSDITGNIEKVNLVKINNLHPIINVTGINYPINQQALKGIEQATIIHTVSNYDSITYESVNAELIIENHTIFESNKTVSRINGGYNVSINNFRITANRIANNASTIINKVVNIANIDPIITIQEQYIRLRSSETGSNYWIKLISSQKLLETPSLSSPVGTFVGNFTTSDDITWSKTISISDTDNKGNFNYISMSAKNLAGKVETAITGDDVIIIGGMTSRKLTFPAFQSTVCIGAKVENTSKISVIDLSGYVFTYQNSFSNNPLTFTIVDLNGVLDNKGDYLKITDLNIVNQNSTSNYYINFEEII